MTRLLIDIDDDALACAARELGAQSTDETANQALADIARRRDRFAALEHLRPSPKTAAMPRS